MASIKFEKKQIVKLCVLITSIALLAAVYLHAYMGTFSRYIADDFCTAGELKAYGYLQAVIHRYLYWDGRFTFTFVIYFFELFGIKLPTILPTIAITAWLLSSYYFVKQIARRIFVKPGKLPILLVSALFAFVILYSIPQVADDFYWMTGITTYPFSILFEFFLLGFVIQYLPEMGERSLAKKILFAVLFFIFSFLCSGFAEVSTALHVAIFGILFVIAIAKRLIQKTPSETLIYWGILFLGAFLGFVVMALAPGNAVRSNGMSTWAVRPGIVELFVNSFKETVKYSLQWLLNYADLLWPAGLLMAFLGAYAPSIAPVRANIEQANKTKWFLIYLACMCVLAFVSFVPTTWMGYKIPPDHTLIMPTSILAVKVFSCSFLLGLALRQTFRVTENKSNLLYAALIVLCLYFAASLPLNYARHYYYNILPAQQTYAKRWDRVNAQILNQVKSGQEYVVSDNVANNVMDNERITDDPGFWVNQCAAAYYQVKQIVSH